MRLREIINLARGFRFLRVFVVVIQTELRGSEDWGEASCYHPTSSPENDLKHAHSRHKRLHRELRTAREREVLRGPEHENSIRITCNLNCSVISVERKRRARDWPKLFLIGGFYRWLAFVVDKLSFSSSSCPDENARKFLVRFRLRSRRGENLMELRNSVWNELCMTVGRTTTKMNAHFKLSLGSFVCRQWTLTGSACWPACLFHLKIFPFWLLEAWL